MGHYKRRNCRKYFPELVTPKSHPWVPEYTAGNLVYVVPDVQSDECPVSLITQESLVLLRLESQNGSLHKAAGASIGGPDAGAWPAWWADVVTTISRARNAEENARIEAQSSQHGR